MFESVSFDNFIYTIYHNYHPKLSPRKFPCEPLLSLLPPKHFEFFHHRFILFLDFI